MFGQAGLSRLAAKLFLFAGAPTPDVEPEPRASRKAPVGHARTNRPTEKHPA